MGFYKGSFLLVVLAMSLVVNAKDDLTDILKTSDRIREQALSRGSLQALFDAQPVQSDKARPDNTQPVKPSINDQVDVFVFISKSMPDWLLRQLFKEADLLKGQKNIAFVTRGWKQGEFMSMARSFAQLWPKRKGMIQPAVMLTDPKLFREFNIEQVPVYSIRTPQRFFINVKGARSIQSAVEQSASLQHDTLLSGELYPISEPDLLTEIEQAVANFDPNQAIQHATENILTDRVGIALKPATRSRTYDVDLTQRVKRTLVSPSGDVIAHQGQTINPLEVLSVPQQFAFFDPSDPRQIHTVQQWMATKEFVVPIATQLPSSSRERSLLNQMFQQEVRGLNRLIVQRFQLTEVPSLVYQNGTRLQVHVEAVEK